MLDKSKFNLTVAEYKKVPMFTIKADAYKSGFKDGVALALEIFEQHETEQANKPDPNKPCKYCGSLPIITRLGSSSGGL